SNFGDEAAEAGWRYARARQAQAVQRRQAPTPRAAEAPELAALRQQLAEKKAERDATTTPGEQVEQTFLQRLVRAGAMRPADARYLGILLRQNAERRAAGAAGEEAFAQAGGEHAVLAEVEGVEEEARPSLEQALEKVKLGALLNELRLGLQPELKGLPKWPILQALRPTQYGGGGVAPGSKLAGELLNMGITPQSLPGLYRVGGNTDLDQFDLTDNPYLVGLEMDAYGRPSDRAVLDAIDKEWRGNPLRTEEQLEGIQARQIPREELGRILDQLGIDLKTTTNEEVITDLEQRFSDRGIEPEVLEETVEGDEFFQQSIAQGWHAVDATPEQQVALDRIIDAHPRAAEIREQFELHRGTPYHDQAAYGAITRQHLEDLLAGLEVDYESGLDNPRFTKVKAAAAAGPEALWAYLETNSFIGRAGKPINSVNSTFLNCRPSLACAKFCYATDGNYRFDNTVFKAELVNWAVENDPVRAAQMAARQYKATAEYLLDKALRLNDKGDISEAWIPFIEELNRQDVRVQVFSKRPEVLRQVPEVNLRLLSVDDTNSQQMAADNPDLMLAVVYQGVEDIPFLVQYADRVQVILPVKLGRRTLSKDEIAPIPKDMRKHICPVDGFGKTVGKTADGKWNCTRCDKNGGLGCYVNTTTKSVLKQLRKDIQNEPDELQTRLDEIRELAGTMEGEERQRLLGRVDLLVSAIRRGVDLEKEEGVIADDEASRDRLTVLEQAALPDERPLEGAFFSALGRALRTSPQRSMSLPELQAYLKKRGVKQEEIEWTMLEDFFEFASLQHWLASNPDTRPPGPQADMKLDLDSLMEQIKLIKVEEVVLGGEWGWRGAALDATDPEDVGAWALGLNDPWEQVVEGEVPGEDEGLWQVDARGQNEAGDEWHYTVTWDEEAGELSVFDLDEEADASAERIYHQALEGHRGSPPDLDDVRDAAGGAIREDVRAKTRAKLRQRGIGGPAQYGEWTLPGGENYREYLITLPVTGDAFTDGHFGDVAPNVLVHARVKDRVGPNGEKILFIEEIQDDWAKEGREKGYGAGLSEEEMEELASLEQKYRSVPRPSRLRRFIPILQRIKQLQAKSTQPPDRPFKASGASSMLALKRMIAKAAKEGYDSVAWTTGKIQVDRYQDELRQSVDAIQWNQEHGRDSAYQYSVIAVQAVKDGGIVLGMDVAADTGLVVASQTKKAVGKPLESVVGKDIAAKILGETEGEVSGDDLTIGGKGFEDLYDGILVRGADKLGKKFGTKVEKAELEAPTTIDPSGRLRYEVWEEPVHLAMGEVIGEPRLEDAFETMAQAQERTAELNENAQTQDAEFRYRAVDGGKAGRRPTIHNLPISEELRASVEGEGLPLFQAAGTGPRGSLKFDADLRNIIMRFTEASDLSTGLHELGHLFFLFMGQDVQRPGADQKLLADMQAAFDYFGLTENKARALKEAQRAAKSWAKKEGVPVPEITLEDLEAVLDAGLDIDPSNPAHRFASVGFHEIWAKSFEAYLFEGRAPSVELEGAFRRFRQWLLQVYRTILKLNVELTPEIREVFDRLLATDEQIERVRSQPHMQPKFESAEAGGMNEAEFADYQAAYERMKAKAEREIMVKLMAEKRREQTEEWALEYERMYAQAEADINAQPAYQLRHWLQRGELLGQETPEELEHVRLDRAAVVRLYGKEILNVLPSRGTYSVVQKGGVDPDVLAPFFGFKTGDALVRALAETINREKAITQEADARMKARFGDMLNDGTIGELAIASMEGEARSTFLGRELRLLARRAGQRGTPQAVARRVAKRVIAGKRVRDLRPDLYRRAEERNAREILEAIAAGDHARAHQAGMEQLHNHFLVVESMRAKEQAQKWSDYLRRMDTLTTRARIGKAGEDYLDQIDALLDRFDFRKISNKAADRRASLAKWIAEQEAADETAVFEISDALREEASSKPWREMTMEELRDLVDAVKNIEHLALLKGKLLRAKEQRDLNAAVERALEGIETNRRSDREALPVETRTVEQRWIRRVGQWFAGHRKFASLLLEMDGGPGGAFFDLILRPMDESGDFETAEREKAWNALKELFRPFVPLDQRVKQLATTVTRGKVDAVKPDIELARHVPGTGTNVPALTLQGRLMAVLNMGNAGNRQRLLDNYGWTENDAKAIIDSLSREQMDFVQGVWDFIDSYWEASAAQQRRISGVVPQRIERVPLQTKWGMYAGGYLPAVYDALQSERAYSQDVANAAADTMRGAHTRAVTRRSHMKERAVKVTDRKIRLDFGVIFEHVDGVIHALAWHEWLIDANKIIGDPRISDAIKRGYGEPVYRDLAKALEDFAAGDVAAEDIRETAFNWLRMGSSVAGMGYNVMTAALQPYGLTQSMVRIGPKWVGVGIAKWLRGADVQETTVKWIYSKSSMMENRSRTMNREIREIQSRVSKGGLFDPISDSYFYLIVKAQQIVDIPTWLGAYEKEMDNSGDESRAIAMADRAVIDAQGGGQIQDLARFQRGSPMFKLWTNFYSFFNTTYNLTAESYERTDFKNPGEVGRFAVDMLLLYTLPSVMTSMMSDAIYQRYDDDESWGEYALELLTLGQLSYVANTMVGVRELSGGLQGWFDYDGPAGTRFFSAAGDLMRQVSQGELDFSLLKALNQTGGILFHYPSVLVQRFADGVISLESGEATSPTVLLTGPPKKRK
ncbi:MAG: hypothetical protein CMF57_13215, partial [Leifsonia sp.]|nr:hypothetical protein [Leifsonia sp.]